MSGEGDYDTEKHKWACDLDLVLVEEHVGNAIGDGEYPSGFRTLQLTLEHIDLEEQVMELLEECLVVSNVFRLHGGYVFC